MAIIAVKKYCIKNGVKYGPYPKDPEQFYLYKVWKENNRVKQRYLGRGTKSERSTIELKVAKQIGTPSK